MTPTLKKIWDYFTDHLGNSVLHPQYVIKKYNFHGVRVAQKYAKGKLIDIGCGRMPYRHMLEHSLTEYIGHDHPIVSKLYKNTTYKPDILSDVTSIPVQSKHFDTAIMFEVLEHLPNPSLALKEVHRILKKEAYFIATVPFMYPIHDAEYDYGRYTEVLLRKMMQESGFKKIVIEPQGTFIEFFYLSFIIFLLKKSKDLPIFFLPAIMIPLVPFYLLGNCILFFIVPIIKKLPSTPNYFVLNYLIIAKA